jgi:hypothetical protein
VAKWGPPPRFRVWGPLWGRGAHTLGFGGGGGGDQIRTIGDRHCRALGIYVLCALKYESVIYNPKEFRTVNTK